MVKKAVRTPKETESRGKRVTYGHHGYYVLQQDVFATMGESKAEGPILEIVGGNSRQCGVISKEEFSTTKNCYRD